MIVWLASYPRSGNTFFRVLLKQIFDQNTYSIYGDKSDIAAHKETSDIVGHSVLPEDFDIEKEKESDNLFVIKTHDHPSKIHEGDKVIYLVRDGRESSVSFQNYIQDYLAFSTNLTDVLMGYAPFGAWANHVEQWAPFRRDQTLLMKFEDLVNDAEGQFQVISDFIGIELQGSSIPTFSDLKEINPRFFRSGKIDSWKDVMSDDQVALFELISSKTMNELGYDEKNPTNISPSLSHLLRSFSEFPMKYWNHERELNLIKNDLRKECNESTRLSNVLAGVERDCESVRSQLLSDRERIEKLNKELVDVRKENENTYLELLSEREIIKKYAQESLKLKNIFDKKVKYIASIENKVGHLLSLIQGVAETSLLRSPITKISAYKKMLALYRKQSLAVFIRENQKSKIKNQE